MGAEKMAQMAREFIERGEQIAAANRHNGDTVMRISDTGKPVTLAEIEAQRQGYDHPAMEATRRYCSRDQGDATSDALRYFESLSNDMSDIDQGIPFDAIPEIPRRPRGQAIAMMRAKMLDDLAAARAEVAKINRNIIRFDEDFMP